VTQQTILEYTLPHPRHTTPHQVVLVLKTGLFSKLDLIAILRIQNSTWGVEVQMQWMEYFICNIDRENPDLIAYDKLSGMLDQNRICLMYSMDLTAALDLIRPGIFAKKALKVVPDAGLVWLMYDFIT
jgi:hypothetical protein